MECRYLQICFVLAVVIIGGSYAYGYGRRSYEGRYGHYGHGYHQDPHQKLYEAYHQPRRYGYHQPPGDAYIRGTIYTYGDRKDDDNSHNDDDNHNDDEHPEEGRCCSDDHDRLWRFQISDDYDAYSYLDTDGHTKGFFIDLLRAVCERAQQICYYMVDAVSHCWRTDGERELPGVGLMDNYYDGCLGYWQTTFRRNSFNFSLPFTPDVRASLHYKAGEKVQNLTNVSGAKIGFVAGWPVSQKCFERQAGFVGNSPGKYTPVLFESHGLMTDALQRGEVNAVLTIDTYEDAKLNIQHVDPYFHCTEAGSSLMTMYGSEILNWWNDAFLQMKADGTFRRLCQNSARTHGPIICVQ